MDDNNAIEELKARLDALEKRVLVLEGVESDKAVEDQTESVVDFSTEKTQVITMVPAQEFIEEEPVQEFMVEMPVQESAKEEFKEEFVQEPAEEQAFNLCPNCGCEFEEGMKFCGACGSPLPQTANEPQSLVCKNCGEPLESDCKFCMNCGTKVD